MKQSKREYNPKSSLSLRIIAGVYLLYIVFSLIKEYGRLEEKDKLINIVFILLFTIAALVILITSTLSWIKLSKEEKNQKDMEELNDKPLENEVYIQSVQDENPNELVDVEDNEKDNG